MRTYIYARTHQTRLNTLEHYRYSVRFAFKTSPQDTSWDDLLALWRAADDIDVFESG